MADGLSPLKPAIESLYEHLLRACWRLDALDEWRKETESRVSVLESEVVTEQQARLLREALVKHGQLRLTRLQQLAGLGLLAVGVADLVKGLF